MGLMFLFTGKVPPNDDGISLGQAVIAYFYTKKGGNDEK